MMTQTPRFSVAMFLWLAPEGKAALARFRHDAAPVLARHGVQVDRVLDLRAKGQTFGENPHELPDMFQLVSFPDAAAFGAYVSDPDYKTLAVARDQALRRMVVMNGPVLDLGHLATPGVTTGAGAVADRLYGVGLARFKPGGEAGFAAFNEQAQPLFARHGVHLEAMITVGQVMVPVGDPADFHADRVVVFFLDHAAGLGGYANDPDYAALAPLRDEGLQSYPLFFGAVPAGGQGS